MSAPTSNRREDEELESAPVISVTQVEIDFFDVQYFNAATVLILEYLSLRSLDDDCCVHGNPDDSSLFGAAHSSSTSAQRT